MVAITLDLRSRSPQNDLIAGKAGPIKSSHIAGVSFLSFDAVKGFPEKATTATAENGLEGGTG